MTHGETIEFVTGVSESKTVGISRIILIFSTAAAVVGCTKSSPSFEGLDSSNLPQPLFNGRSSVIKETASPATLYQVDGQCDPRIRDIVASVREGSSASGPLNTIATSVSVQCATHGRFSFVLKSLTGLGITPAEGQTYHVDLRAVTLGGLSQASTINIHFSALNGPDEKHLLLTSGSAKESTSSSYSAVIRIGHRAPAYTGAPKADEVERSSNNLKMFPVLPQLSP